MDILGLLKDVLIWAPVVLIAVVVHEWAHGAVATLLGDPTPRAAGRLSLNPLRHIDLMWSIVIPLGMLVYSLSLLGTPFVFGGAKPVPVNPRNFRGSLRFGMGVVAVAGPLSNLILALVGSVGLGWIAGSALPEAVVVVVGGMLVALIQMNVMLAVFNLVPIPPLDGGRLMVALLPPPLDRQFAGLESFGLVLVLGLAFTGILSLLVLPLSGWLLRLYAGVAGVG